MSAARGNADVCQWRWPVCHKCPAAHAAPSSSPSMGSSWASCTSAAPTWPDLDEVGVGAVVVLVGVGCRLVPRPQGQGDAVPP